MSLQKFFEFGFEDYSKDFDYNKYKGQNSKLSENAIFILESRYLMDRYDNATKSMIKESSYYDLCRRCARLVASGETLYTNDINRIRLIEQNIFMDMWDTRFLFNSPALFNLGIDIVANPRFSELIYDKDVLSYDEYKELYDNKSPFQMCFACFVIPVDDSLIGIYDSVKNAALISMKGGGVGTNFGRTREKGSLIRDGQGGRSSGPLSWMKQWNCMAEEVVQGGRRRAALMGLMDVNHPDIEDFICAKDDDNVLSYFNLSVSITDEFMKAVLNENDHSFTLRSRINPENDKIIDAKELWDKICEHAWKRGDPGIHFIDTSNQDSLLKLNANWPIEATNPCGEMNLPFKTDKAHRTKFCTSDIGCEPRDYPIYESEFSEGGTSCNLGSMNLTRFIEKNENNKSYFNYDKFERQIHRGIYYLDLVIDVSEYPLDGIGKNTKAIRPVGLGMMGIHDAGILLNMPFDTINNDADFKQFCDNIASTMGRESLIASVEICNNLNKEPFSENECVKDLFQEYIKMCYHNTGKKDFKIDDDNQLSQFIYQNLKMFDDNKFLPRSIKNALINLYNNDKNKNKFNTIFKMLCLGRIRNSRRLSIAPTGTISLIADCSSGIEPNFAFSWNRRVNILDNTGKTVQVVRSFISPVVPEEYKQELLDTGRISNNEVFKSALDIDYKHHMGIVGIFAQYIDTSISKCVAKGTKIQTSNGIINIEDFSENRNIDTFVDISDKNIYVKDMNGNWQKVLSHYYGGKKKTIKIRMNNEFILECSENHKLMTENGWKKASDITINDRIEILDCDYNINDKTNLPLKYYYMKIKEITYSENDIFDIEVENTHSYLISGIVSHNTINMPNSATIEDIKNVYIDCYKLGIKGITIYRDGSRSYQPLTTTTKKEEENKTEESTKSNDNINNSIETLINIINTANSNDLTQILRDNENLFNKVFASCVNAGRPAEIVSTGEAVNPSIGIGSFIRIDSPYGTIHVSGKFDSNDRMREVFVTINKSGQELKAITEALSRLISICLQEKINNINAYNRIIKTLKGIGGFEAFVYESLKNGEEYIVKSIPDVLAYIIPDLQHLYMLNKYGIEYDKNNELYDKDNNIKHNCEKCNNISSNENDSTYVEKYNKHKSYQCPQCGGSHYYQSGGCDRCLSCGYSKCSA